jgi:hypothetical protein
MRLINTGNKPLAEDDFEQPVRIELGAPVLSAWLVKADPEELAPEVTWQNAKVEVAPTLFNKGDWVAFGVLTDGEPKEKSINIRIAGVKKSRKFEHQSSSLREAASFIGWMAGAITFLVMALVVDPLTHGDYTRWGDIANPPWQYYAISFAAFIIPITIGVTATRLVRKLSQRIAESMKVVL